MRRSPEREELGRAARIVQHRPAILHGIIKRALLVSLGLVVTSAVAASCSSPCGAQGQGCCGTSCNAGLECYSGSDGTDGTCVQEGSRTFPTPEPVTSDAGEDSAATATEDAGPDATLPLDAGSDAERDAGDASDGTVREDASEADAAGPVTDSGDAGG
jgi:hypothetical protein